MSSPHYLPRLHSLLFVSVLDRHLPCMEPRQLPWGSEPALPFQSGLGPRHPPLQQVRLSHPIMFTFEPYHF